MLELGCQELLGPLSSMPLINVRDSSMLEMKSLLAQKSMAISTQYPVMIIGGAEDKTNGCDILRAFFESAGGDRATIGVIPTASQIGRASCRERV